MEKGKKKCIEDDVDVSNYLEILIKKTSSMERVVNFIKEKPYYYYGRNGCKYSIHSNYKNEAKV